MDSTPWWVHMAGAITDIVTVVAILLGGFVGYVRYLRHRISHAKLDLDVVLECCQLGDREALKVVASIKNDGTCRVGFPSITTQQIQVSACYQQAWDKASEQGCVPQWSLVLVEEFVGETQSLPDLEPGQRLSRQMLLPGVATAPVAYRVRLFVEGQPRPFRKYKFHDPWSTERVIEVSRHG